MVIVACAIIARLFRLGIILILDPAVEAGATPFVAEVQGNFTRNGAGTFHCEIDQSAVITLPCGIVLKDPSDGKVFGAQHADVGSLNVRQRVFLRFGEDIASYGDSIDAAVVGEDEGVKSNQTSICCACFRVHSPSLIEWLSRSRSCRRTTRVPSELLRPS